MKNIESLIDSLPENEKSIVICLQNIIKQSIPDITEKISNSIPFYFRHKRVCFIWPASIAGGGIKYGVLLGFTKGNLLSNKNGMLQQGNRKQVFTIQFDHIKEINNELVKQIVYEAVLVDSQFAKKKITLPSQKR